jgi:hypothetical protein
MSVVGNRCFERPGNHNACQTRGRTSRRRFPCIAINSLYRNRFQPKLLEGVSVFEFRPNQRRKATIDQMPSTNPKGHAPCKKPYADPITHETAKPSTHQRERSSIA